MAAFDASSQPDPVKSDINARFPIGEFILPISTTAAERATWIADLAELPATVRRAAEGLSEQQLETPYRTGGWTIRQVVHHLADSHMNAFIRMKLALTEDRPAVKTYDEVLWAELADSGLPIEPSLQLLEGLHARFADLARSLSEEQLGRSYAHPEWTWVRMDQQIALYSWHGRHHAAHIELARQKTTGLESSSARPIA